MVHQTRHVYCCFSGINWNQLGIFLLVLWGSCNPCVTIQFTSACYTGMCMSCACVCVCVYGYTVFKSLPRRHGSSSKIKGIRKWRETENEAIYMEDMDKAWFWDNRSPLKVSEHKLNICILKTLHGKKEYYPEWDLQCFLQSWWIRCLPLTRAECMNTPTRAASASQGYGWIGEDRLRRVWRQCGSGGVERSLFFCRSINNGKRVDNEGGSLKEKTENHREGCDLSP